MESPLEILEGRLGADWKAIRAARFKTRELLEKLKAELASLEDPACSVIVTGSLGRGEATDDSDADWILLVDGLSDPLHATLALRVQEAIKKVIPKDPGPTGTFGSIVASHELVHYIAGTRDSNENLTRRILLLSESRALTSERVRERVIRNLLARYVVHDRAVRSGTKPPEPIPHFLLNDVVRYWRTMAADFASKMWERHGDGWGIRNIKLRFSRKLVFVWGLLACFSEDVFPPVDGAPSLGDEASFSLWADRIRRYTDEAPLDLLARVCLAVEVKDETARSVFGAYDEFLAALADPGVRGQLAKVSLTSADGDPTYSRLRAASHRFRDGIDSIFFDEHPALPKLIRRYGVF